MNDRVHVVMPAGVRDATRPSGGNAYDVRVCDGLAARGWTVLEHEVPGSWPHPTGVARAALAQVLASVPTGDRVLIDGLLGSTAPETLVPQSNRLFLGVLVHMPLGHAPTGAGAREREQRALDAVDVVVATSDWTRGWLLDAYGLPPSLVRVAVPGADRAAVGVGSSGGGRLLTVGPVSRAKGHDTLVAALDRLTDLDWRLDCVGSMRVDPDTSRRVACWAGRTGRVAVRGPRTGAELHAAYASADLLVHPSRAETYGMVVTEALARGIPVLASDVGGTREAVGGTDGHGPPAVLVEPGDVDGLTAALAAWLTDAGQRARLRQAALTRRDQLPTWDAAVTVVEHALRANALTGAVR